MENLKFKVRGMAIELVDAPKVVTLNWCLKAEFEFSSEDTDWNGVKTAIFEVNGESYAMILDKNNSCLIPEECYRSKNLMFTVGCISENMTTSKVNIKFVESCYSENTTISNPTEDVYIQIINKINSIDSGEVSQEEFDGVKDSVNKNSESIEDLKSEVSKNKNALIDLNTQVDDINETIENRTKSITCETSKSLKVLKTSAQSLVANTSTLLTWQSITSKDDINDIFVINPSNQSLVVVKDVKRIEVLIQLTAQTITDIVGIYWYVQLKHVSGDNEVEVSEYSAKSNNYYQSKFIIDNIKVGDEIFFETSSNKALNIMNDSKFTSAKFVVYYDKVHEL